MISERTYPARSQPLERGVTLSLRQYWDKIGLGLVLLLAALLNFYGLGKEGYSNTYYAAAVKSMSENWHAFFFNSLDPAGFVTIDKPPLGFWLQVASVKLFGYSGVALMLPQALAGVVSVTLLYYLVARLFGKPAGLLAALALAVTPISVVSNRNNIVDSTLVLAVLLGAWAISRAVETGKLRWLLLCAVFVGLGFNIKMLQAFLVFPAFGLMYLLGARVGWRKRIVHLFVAAVVLLVISLSWATAVDLTPASQRPWVGSTTDNSELSLAIGYNGLQRLTGNSSVGSRNNGPPAGFRTSSTRTSANARMSTGGSTTSQTNATRPTITNGSANGGPGNGGGPGGVGENGPKGALRLLDTQLGGQIGWLLPLAVVGFFVAAWQARRRRLLRTDAETRTLQDGRRSALVMWGMWLLTMDVFFDIAGFYHTYYLVMIAPAIAALSGIGVVALWRAFRESDSKLWWLLPASLLAVAAVQVHILGDYPAWSRWMSPLILALAVLGALVLTVLRLVPGLRFRPVLAALLIGVTALLAAPGVWSFETVQAANAGITPRAGPAGTTGMGGPGGAGFRPGNGGFGPPNGSSPPPGAQSGVGGGSPPAFGPPPGGSGSSSTGSSGRMQDTPTGGFRMNGGGPGDDQVNKTLLRFLEAHQGNATYLFATPSAGTAEAYIIAGGKAVMAMGGFTGSDPILTPSKLATLAGEGRVKYFLVSGGGFGGPGGNSSLTSWIQQHSKLITVAGTQLYEYTG